MECAPTGCGSEAAVCTHRDIECVGERLDELCAAVLLIEKTPFVVRPLDSALCSSLCLTLSFSHLWHLKVFAYEFQWDSPDDASTWKPCEQGAERHTHTSQWM